MDYNYVIFVPFLGVLYETIILTLVKGEKVKNQYGDIPQENHGMVIYYLPFVSLIFLLIIIFTG